MKGKPLKPSPRPPLYVLTSSIILPPSSLLPDSRGPPPSADLRFGWHTDTYAAKLPERIFLSRRGVRREGFGTCDARPVGGLRLTAPRPLDRGA